MGKTPKPLSIRIHPDLVGWPEIQALGDQGHVIQVLPEEKVDLILGPSCWRMDQAHRKYLALAVAAARHQRYPKEK